MTHPNIITEAMADGSDAISDWPLLNALLTTATRRRPRRAARGRRRLRRLLAERRHDGGRDRHATTAPRACAARCTSTPRSAVLRHADAGYEDAQDAAREHGLGLTP